MLRYLKGSLHLKLHLSSKDDNEFYGYADANWAENRTDRKSNSGYFFKLHGGTIAWHAIDQSKHQS